MADTKITGLSADTAPDAADVFPFVDVSASTTEKVTLANLITAVLADHLADTADAHDASAISIADSAGVITATEVEAALAEIAKGLAQVNTVAASGSTETLTLAPVHKVTMDQNCTFTFPTPTIASHTFILHLLGAFTPTFPGSVDWGDAAAPTYTTPSLYVFFTDDTGTIWLGSQVGKAFA